MAVETVHFLVHPAYASTLLDRPNDMPRIMDAYCSKISAIAENPKARLYIVPPERDRVRREIQRDLLDELLLHAKLEMPGRFKEFSRDSVDDQELFRLKRELSEGARLHFWGEYFGNCVHEQALKAAFALGVTPEEAGERISFNRAHSVKKGKNPLYLKTFGNREEHLKVRQKVKENAEVIKKGFLQLYQEYHARRDKGELHHRIISDFINRQR